MYLRDLEIRDVRILAHAALAAAPGVNLLTGRNASGKTSVLEAIHLLGTGRSFRVASVLDVVRRDSAGLVVRGRVAGGAEETGEWLAVERGSTGSRSRRGNEDVRTASDLARHLPLVFVAPEAQRLLTDGAPMRRALVDWLLFHVEQDYHGAYQRYRRLLRQRNAGLRQGESDRALSAWEGPLGSAAETLEEMRARELAALLPRVSEVLGELSELEVAVRYLPGWRPGESLVRMLAAQRAEDRARGYTLAGPHRADLRFTVRGRPAHRILSRGEGKLFVVGMHLALASALMERAGKGPVLLVDDLAAELDVESRQRAFGTLRQLGLQAFVTGVSEGTEPAAGWDADRVFHVEQGEVREVV